MITPNTITEVSKDRRDSELDREATTSILAEFRKPHAGESNRAYEAAQKQHVEANYVKKMRELAMIDGLC